MSDFVTASFDTLLGQASDTAATYLGRAVQEIDTLFGKGYARQYPRLVAAFMQTAAIDMSASTHAKVYGAALQEISSSLSAIADAIDRKGV
ncbi:hypothetical protein ABQJ54_07205 [Rhodanobacter sp. Si-c]|uniref:Uncharacterized protein n=1 Tax=Rhodanobacter lycopersici TaxID=3162487 RepID=A0ABV3QCG3_9GAMM